MANEIAGPTIQKMPITRISTVARQQAATPSASLPAQRGSIAAVAGMLFFSGMCGLVFQVSWFRVFPLVFGASTAASSAVLAVFMGGLGLGNAVWGKQADRATNPLALYALLELSIALTAACSPLLIGLLHHSYISLGGELVLGSSAATAVRLAISALVLGAPTFLMGGTLPTAVRAVTVGEDPRRRRAALLYGVNTLGAVVGAVTSTFFALEFFGTRKTLWLACLINTCIALCALVLSRRGRKGTGTFFSLRASTQRDSQTGRTMSQSAAARAARSVGQTPARNDAPQAAKTTKRGANDQVRPPPFPAYVVYSVAGIAGFAFFLMELVWYRMLGPILGGTTFTFGLILAVALTGIGLGGTAYAAFFRRAPVSLHSLALTCVLEACCMAIPFALGDRLAILAAVFRAANTSSFLGEVGGWAMIASLVILPAAFVSGLQFPLLVGLLGQGEENVGEHVGLACSWNTVGAICGALAGGFGLLPLLTAPGVWRAVAVLLAVLGASVCVVARGPRVGVPALAGNKPKREENDRLKAGLQRTAEGASLRRPVIGFGPSRPCPPRS